MRYQKGSASKCQGRGVLELAVLYQQVLDRLVV